MTTVSNAKRFDTQIIESIQSKLVSDITESMRPSVESAQNTLEGSLANGMVTSYGNALAENIGGAIAATFGGAMQSAVVVNLFDVEQASGLLALRFSRYESKEAPELWVHSLVNDCGRFVPHSGTIITHNGKTLTVLYPEGTTLDALAAARLNLEAKMRALVATIDEHYWRDPTTLLIHDRMASAGSELLVTAGVEGD